MPVDKHGSVKVLPHPLLITTKGSKVNYLNFAITKAIVNIFAVILHAGRAAISMNHIERDFSLKTCVPAPVVDLGDVGRDQN